MRDFKNWKGVPIRLSEVELTLKTQKMDSYHRLLMEWLVYEVKRLKKGEKKDAKGKRQRLASQRS